MLKMIYVKYHLKNLINFRDLMNDEKIEW